MASSEGQPEQCVVLLHGIGQTRWNMLGAERALKRQGFAALNLPYPSTKANIASLADFLRARLDALRPWERHERIHFLTHSMGGLVVDAYLRRHPEHIPQGRLGRVVMLAPPMGGSEVASLLQGFPPYRWLFGPAGSELSTTARQERMAAAASYELGIIAGRRGRLYPLARLAQIKGAHDGRVSVEHTKMPGMKAHLVLDTSHSLIAWMPAAHKQIASFLRHGVFRDNDARKA